MPIQLRIDSTENYMVETWTGVVTAAEIQAYWDELTKNPLALEIRRTIADLRDCTIEFSGEDLMRMVNEIVVPRLKGQSWRTALVVAGGPQYGTCRQYQVFAETYSKDRIFEDLDKAKAWLLS